MDENTRVQRCQCLKQRLHGRNPGSADIVFSIDGNFADVASTFAKIGTVLVSVFVEMHLLVSNVY